MNFVSAYQSSETIPVGRIKKITKNNMILFKKKLNFKE